MGAHVEAHPTGPAAKGAPAIGRGIPSAVDARVKLACLVVYVIGALHARSALSLGLFVVVAIAAAIATRMRLAESFRVLRPLAPILVITVVMQILYLPQGEALLWVGPIAITFDALVESARMIVSLFCIMLASMAFMRCSTTEELVRTLRWLLSPLRALSLRVDAFMLSLSIAFRFVPVLVNEFCQLKRAQEARAANFGGGVRERLAAYMRLFGPLLRSAYRKADMLSEALLARCFSCCASPTSLHVGHVGVCDAICLAVVILVCTAAFI